MRHLLFCIGVLCPSVVLADCPTASDLQTGIRFSVDDDATETFRTLRPGVVEAVFSYDDGYASRNLLAQGVYLLEVVDLADGVPEIDTRTTYAFPQNAVDLPVPKAGASLSFDVVVNVGGAFERETQAYTVGAETIQVFGACQYRMLPIEVRYPVTDDGTVDTLHYLADLGIAYFAASTYDDGSDVYTYHAIEALR